MTISKHQKTITIQASTIETQGGTIVQGQTANDALAAQLAQVRARNVTQAQDLARLTAQRTTDASTINQLTNQATNKNSYIMDQRAVIDWLVQNRGDIKNAPAHLQHIAGVPLDQPVAPVN